MVLFPKIVLFVILFKCNAHSDNSTNSPAFDCISKNLALAALQKNENMVVSTLALRFGLCKLASASDGDTKEELLKILGITKESMTNDCFRILKYQMTVLKETYLIWLNKIYINYTDYVNPNFMTNSMEDYGVHVEKISFKYAAAASMFINQWVDTATYRRITDITNSKDFDSTTSMVLLNAAHMKLTWEFPFDIMLTTNKKFRLLNNELVYIPMMTKLEEFLFYEDANNNVQMLSMYIAGSDCSMMFVVPDKASNLSTFLATLAKDPDIINRNKKKMKNTYLKILIPKFKIKTLIDWTGYMKQLGVMKIFDSKANGFPNITKDKTKTTYYLSKAIQKIFIDVEEMGLYRHLRASDELHLDRQSDYESMGTKQFAADRPFYFTISIEDGNKKSYDLFNGVYYGPQ